MISNLPSSFHPIPNLFPANPHLQNLHSKSFSRTFCSSQPFTISSFIPNPFCRCPNQPHLPSQTFFTDAQILLHPLSTSLVDAPPSSHARHHPTIPAPHLPDPLMLRCLAYTRHPVGSPGCYNAPLKIDAPSNPPNLPTIAMPCRLPISPRIFFTNHPPNPLVHLPPTPHLLLDLLHGLAPSPCRTQPYGFQPL